MRLKPRCVAFGCVLIATATWLQGAPPRRAPSPGKAPPASKPSDREARLAARQDSRLDQEAAELYRTADTTFLVGDPERAADLFQKLLSSYPNSAYTVRAHARIGDCVHEQRKYAEAANHYRRAAAAAEAAANDDETTAGVRADYMVGQCYIQAKQYTPAFGALRRFIDHHPGHPLVNAAYQAIGDAHRALNQHQQALKAYRMVGTVIDEKTAAHRRIAPGQRLYLRVTDADVNVGEKLRSVFATIKTTSGDVELVELEPLGQRSPIFLATVPTALGSPRHSGELKQIFSEPVAAKIRASLIDADDLERKAAASSEEAMDVERGPQKMVNPAAAEKRRAELTAQSQALMAKAKAMKTDACKLIDAAFAAYEKKVAAWAPEQAIARQTTTAPSTAPSADLGKPTDTLEAIAARPLAGAGDEELVAPPGASPDAERRGMSEGEILQVRRSVVQTPTNMENIDARLTTLSVWGRALHRQFQRLELAGRDRIEIEYFDEVGPDGPNAKNTIRRDVVEVAADATVDVLAPDGREPLPQVVLNSTIIVRVEDFDADVSDAADTVSVVVAAVPILDQRPGDLPATAPATQRATPGEVTSEDPAQKKLPLVPEGAASVKLTLAETGPHTGVFQRAVTVTDKALIGDADAALALKNEQSGNLLAIRVAYVDARAIRHADGWVLAKAVDSLADSGGTVAAVKYRQTPLDMEAKLRRAVAAGEIGKIYLDLGLTRRGREQLASAQADCDEVARAGEKSKLGEDALHHAWKIYFYAGLLDEAVSACRLLMARYPNSDYIPDAMYAMGEASLEKGIKQVRLDEASGAKATLNRDLSRAISQFEDLVKRYPKSTKAPEALFQVGQAKIIGGQTGLDTFERLAKEYPDSILSAKGLTRVADYYWDIHDHRRAHEYYVRVLNDYPDAPEQAKMLLRKGLALKQLGQTPEALQTFYRVVEEHSGTKEAGVAQENINWINQKRGGSND